MALLSFHCQNYKAGALVGIDGHNRRLHKNHKSNPDIDNERSANNQYNLSSLMANVFVYRYFVYYFFFFVLYIAIPSATLFLWVLPFTVGD